MQESGKFIGFVDMFDIVCFVLRLYTKDTEGTITATKLFQYYAQMCQDDEVVEEKELFDTKLWCDDLNTLGVRGKIFANHSVKDCVGNFIFWIHFRSLKG